MASTMHFIVLPKQVSLLTPPHPYSIMMEEISSRDTSETFSKIQYSWTNLPRTNMPRTTASDDTTGRQHFLWYVLAIILHLLNPAQPLLTKVVRPCKIDHSLHISQLVLLPDKGNVIKLKVTLHDWFDNNLLYFDMYHCSCPWEDVRLVELESYCRILFIYDHMYVSHCWKSGS